MITHTQKKKLKRERNEYQSSKNDKLGAEVGDANDRDKTEVLKSERKS